MLATPFAALGGLAWGVLSAGTLGVASPLFWGSLGAFSFAFLIYLELLLVPPLAALSDRVWPGSGFITALFWEAVVVGGLAFLLTSVLGAPTAPAIGTALGIGAVYTLVMEYVLCGSAAADFSTLVSGPVGRGAVQRDRYSHVEALISQGRLDDAVVIYSDAIANDPRSGSPYLGLARTLSIKGVHEEALEVLRAGRRTADLTYDQEAFFVRQIAELCATKLGSPEEAVEDLVAFLTLRSDGPHVEWAERELQHIDAATEEESDPEGRQPPAPDPEAEIERFDASPNAGADPQSSTPLEFNGPGRLTVDDDFRLADQYDLGEPPGVAASLCGNRRLRRSASDGAAPGSSLRPGYC